MGKKNKGNPSNGDRTRINPITGQQETVTGPKAGRRRSREPYGSPLRTHDLHPPGYRKQRSTNTNED
jgi:hypothetical protein